MKKTLFVVALATMLVFVVAGSAIALPTYGGQNRAGKQATANANVPVTATETVITGPGTQVYINGVGWATGTVNPGVRTLYGAGTNTYEDWSVTNGSLGFGNAGSNSPHGNFTTTTVKCVVCHAVHYAAPGTAPVSGGVWGNGTQTADTLLRMRADQACIFCHATAGQAVNGTPVYDGLGTTLIGNTGGATNTGHVTGTNCSVCHSTVHGADADHSVASLDGFLLRKIPVSAVTTQGASTSDMLDAIKAIDFFNQNQGFAAGAALGDTWGNYQTINDAIHREQAVGVFCAECHNGAYATGVNGAGASTNINGSNIAQYTGHRIGAAATQGLWNSTTDKVSSSSIVATTVAWKPATNCKSCHDSNDVFGNVAFPHSWGGTKMWLLVAADAGASETALPYGTTPGSGWNEQSPQLSDGVCLKCHVAPGATQGVGITF